MAPAEWPPFAANRVCASVATEPDQSDMVAPGKRDADVSDIRRRPELWKTEFA